MDIEKDKRSILRLPCSIAVTSAGRSSPLGDITDISLDGFHVATQRPLPLHSVVPVLFQLGKGGATVRPRVEVVRVTDAGMGLRFTALASQDKRRLRRYITELANVVGNRASAKALTSRNSNRTAEPFTDPKKIRALLLQAAGSSSFTLIPHERVVREKGTLTEVCEDKLQFKVSANHDLSSGENVFVLYTLSFVSYSFEAKVIGMGNGTVTVTSPNAVSYSEQRTKNREGVNAAKIYIDLPWRPGVRAEWDVIERSDNGLSFRANTKDTHFWPGTVLPNFTVVDGDREQHFQSASVRHLTAIEVEEGQDWVKVGVGFNVAAGGEVSSKSEALASEEQSKRSSAFRWVQDLAAKVAYLYHRKALRLEGVGHDTEARVIKFNNTMGQKIVGLLNMSDVSSSDAQKSRVPVVIVTPGFGARKETMGALTAVITENFRRHYKGVAVLRYDGTNSMGESFKDPGCEAEGKESIHYTVSGGISDVVAATRWVKSNKYFEAAEIIVVSVSFSSVAVRRALTMTELSDVRLWVSFMGAPDAQNAIMNVAGNVDGYGHHLQGVKLGVVALLGCLIDCDYFCADMKKLEVANLDDARRDMKRVKANVVWFVGKHDAFMDGQRVNEIMAVPGGGARKVIEVEAGHVPQSSDEAMAEFMLMTRYIWRELFHDDLEPIAPSRGKLAAVMEKEWARVRRGSLASQKDYWEKYLLGGQSGIGFDVWNLTPEYAQLLDDTVARLPVKGCDVLDLGAGTGNVAAKVVDLAPRSLTCADIVPAAVEKLLSKIGGRKFVKGVVTTADGSPRVAVRRWLAGDLPSFGALIERLPGRVRQHLLPLVGKYEAGLHSYLRGAPVDLGRLSEQLSLTDADQRAAESFHKLALIISGRHSADQDAVSLDEEFREIADCHDGLPFPDASFDTVVSSLVLSYMNHVEDTLFEVRRVLRPGGVFVASTLLPDTDQSKNFLNIIKKIESMPEVDLPGGEKREVILQALREFVDAGSELLRLEEEGVFRFWSGGDFVDLLARGGFRDLNLTLSFGVPAQGAIVRCVR